MRDKLIIAVDGPAGAGKSTISKILAKKLCINYIDTGAMYRAITLKCLKNGVKIDDTSGIIKVSETSVITFRNGVVYLDNKDVSKEIRMKEVSEMVSYVSKVPKVRENLVNMQRKIAEEKSSILDGRDIGTVVFPNADFKFFLVADPKVRGERRYKEMLEKGTLRDGESIESIISNIVMRDKIDSSREVSPLKKASDAIEIDTSDLSIDEVVDLMMKKVKSERR